MMKFSELSRIVGGSLAGPDGLFSGVSIDTRSLRPGELYVGIRGQRYDGNDFAAAAKDQGASAALVERPMAVDLPQIIVADSRLALGKLAAEWRNRWGGRLAGVTGSNGKTTVKEMLAAVLEESGATLRTQGNLNNDLGVPLTLLRLRPEHRYAVVEMGANHAGEIAYTAGLARPDVALITNAGAAHLEGFGSLDGVARAKGELVSALPPEGLAILNREDRYFEYWCDLAGPRRVISFGTNPGAEVRAEAGGFAMHFDEAGFRSEFDLQYLDRRHPVTLRLAGAHNLINALAAAAAGLALGLPLDQIGAGLGRVSPVPGRLQALRSREGALLIDDSYNANPASFSAALEVLMALPGEPWVVLGGFGELGEHSVELHAALGRQAKHRGVARLWAIGPHAERAVESFGAGAQFFPGQAELVSRLERELNKDAVVLVKGSRSQHLERVVKALVTGEREVPCC